MRQALPLLVALGALAPILAGCGGHNQEPIVAPEIKQTGTVSAALARTALISDVRDTRRVMDASAASKSIVALYTLLNTAGAEKNIRKSAGMLRAKVPPLVDRFEAGYRRTVAKLRSLRLRTAAGRKFRAMDVALIEDWHRELPRFRDDLATSATAWGAASRFGARNNALLARENKRLDALLASLTPAEQKLLMQAVKETFG